MHEMTVQGGPASTASLQMPASRGVPVSGVDPESVALDSLAPESCGDEPRV
jgi:hypothetical protein